MPSAGEGKQNKTKNKTKREIERRIQRNRLKQVPRLK